MGSLKAIARRWARAMGGALLAAAMMLSLVSAEAAAQDNPNVKQVQAIYAAFGKGDVATIINSVSPDVDWVIVGAKADCACFGKWPGKAGVGDFFKTIGEIWNFTAFNPREFIASGDRVVVLGNYAMIEKKTGKSVQSEWVHVFTLKDGKVTAFREFNDTAAIAMANRGS